MVILFRIPGQTRISGWNFRWQIFRNRTEPEFREIQYSGAGYPAQPYYLYYHLSVILCCGIDFLLFLNENAATRGSAFQEGVVNGNKQPVVFSSYDHGKEEIEYWTKWG